MRSNTRSFVSEAMVFLCVYLLGFWPRGTQIANLRQRRRADVGGGGGEVNDKLPEPSVWWGREPVRGGREEGESERVDRALSCLAIALSAFCFLLFL